MAEETIVKNTPQRRMSLRWKWALGSAVGVFLIFMLFALFLNIAFSNELVHNEKLQMQHSALVIKQRLGNLDKGGLDQQSIDHLLSTKGTDFSEITDDPIAMNVSKPGYQIALFKVNGQQVYPKQATDLRVKPGEKHDFYFEHKVLNLKGNLFWQEALYNNAGQKLGYIVTQNNLAVVHKIFQRIYLISGLLIAIGLMLIALFGYWWSGLLLQPVADIQKVVDHLKEDPQAPDRVIIQSRFHDELSSLAELVNDMLNRMQRFILQQHQFVEDVSHELRTPVAIVKGHMELLNRWGKDDPAILAESITASLTEMRRMEGLVQEMLDLTRADQVELTFTEGDTDVQDVIHSVYNNFKMIYPEFTFGLEDDLEGPTIVNMSRDHLEQILIILSDNAVKYSRKRQEVHFAASSTGPVVMLAVQDFGEGIKPQDAERVFDRFYRVDKARSRKQGGNGLGLSIAQKLIEGYGGHIELESVLGQGSIFRITLPIKAKNK
ncbi:two-component histidine kinase [Weissella oryzae SG25]|uniref:Signal transduction histidine-protein kinase ArlS n=1 Tax=Weissella oryzae (strain DSM 25784 / JCM 18191 / LMG 30913 / SG25) TaxID=1329250 RepID=A0A069CT20_WEIOS|nr:HAMP domain-containing histidine kinase [Weissella oryzae]GAK30373.1 two-component histidine kinase [Weissella oryzae SG25]